MTVATRTHYDVLGVARDADDTELRRAWKLLVQVWHPDRFDGATRVEAERMAATINEAYHTLRDPRARERYDARIVAATPSSPSPSPRHTAPHPDCAAGARIAPAAQSVSVAGAAEELVRVVREHPRLVLAVAAAWVTLVLGSATLGSFASPSLPAGDAGGAMRATQAEAAASVLSDDIARTVAPPEEDSSIAPEYGVGPTDEELYAPPPDLPPPPPPRRITVRPNNR